MESEYLCPYCGAPLEVTPETIIAVCNYCGKPKVISGVVSIEDIYIVPTLNKSYIEKIFKETIERDFDLRRIKKDIEFYNSVGTYVPIWVSKVHLKGKVSYYHYKTENKKRKRVYRVETIDMMRNIPIVARRQITPLGISELLNLISSRELSPKRLTDVSVKEWREMRLEVLNTEYDKKGALERIQEDSLDRLREEFKKKSDGIDGFQVKVVSLSEPKLLLVPLWRVYYNYKDSVYQMIYAGWNGELLVKTEPVTVIRRIAYVLGSIALVFITGLATVLLLSQKEVELNSLIFSLFLMGMTYFTARKIIKGVRLER